MRNSRQHTAAIAVTLLLLGATLISAQGPPSIQDLSQQAKRLEDIGEYEQAIKIYERIVQGFSSQTDSPFVAKATLQLGTLWMALGQASGQEYLQLVIDKYGRDYPQLAAQARDRLNVASKSTSPIEIVTPYTNDPFAFAISPDGKNLVFHVAAGGKEKLWIEDIDTRQARAIPGAEGTRVQYPFWSPDGRNIGFFGDGKLKRIPVAGGRPQELADAQDPYGGTWSRSGMIVFSPYSNGPLYRVPENGGTRTAVTELSAGATGHHFPLFLADDRHFLYFTTTRGPRSVIIGSLDSLQARVLSRQDQPNGTGAGVNFAANYLFSFHVVGTFAQRLDPVTMTLTGDRRKVADTPAAGFLGTGIAPFSASARRLALRVNPKYQRGLAWSDREGRQVVDPDGPELNETNVERIRISPDGRSLAAYRDSSIVQLDLLSGAERFIGGELIGSGKLEGNPVWSPNGELFAYDSIAPDIYNLNLYIKSPGADDARRLLSLPEDQNPTDWLDDGHGNQFLLYERSDQYTGRDLLVLPLDGKQTPILIAGTKARETNGRFSPNGKWIAYQSNEEGERNEIYVQPFPGTTNLRRKISGNGGSNPKWSRDGNELYFLSPDNHLMVVAVTFSPNGESITTVTPAPLFSSTLPEGAEFEPHPDGRRFLINAPAEGLPPVSPILVLSDWMSILSNTPVSATSQPTPTRDKGLSSQ